MNAGRPPLRPLLLILAILALGYFLLRRPSETVTVVSLVDAGQPNPAPSERTLEIVTLLPRDAIRSIDDPQLYSASEADKEYAPEELVLGVALNGESRAYSTALLSRHEIVNDKIGGRKIAVTW